MTPRHASPYDLGMYLVCLMLRVSYLKHGLSKTTGRRSQIFRWALSGIIEIIIGFLGLINGLDWLINVIFGSLILLSANSWPYRLINGLFS